MDVTGQDPVVCMQPTATPNETKRKVSIVEAPHAYDNNGYDSGHKRKTSQVRNNLSLPSSHPQNHTEFIDEPPIDQSANPIDIHMTLRGGNNIHNPN